MRRNPLIVAAALLLVIGLAGSEDFKPYPGSKVDKEATQEAMEMLALAKSTGTKVTIYTSEDPFDKVTAYFIRLANKGVAKEYAMPGTSGSAGKPVKFEGEDEGETYDLFEAFFIFDGASDLKDSTFWVKVQRPYIGGEIRDVTAIVVTEKTR